MSVERKERFPPKSLFRFRLRTLLIAITVIFLSFPITVPWMLRFFSQPNARMDPLGLKVTGKVTLDGKAVDLAEIRFYYGAKRWRGSRTDDQGEYTIRLEPGRYRVVIRKQESLPLPFVLAADPDENPMAFMDEYDKGFDELGIDPSHYHGPQLIPSCFSDPQESSLSAKVGSYEPQRIDFRLTSISQSWEVAVYFLYGFVGAMLLASLVFGFISISN